MTKGFTLSALAVLAIVSGCTVHQTDTPGLSGPSELGQSVTVTATPDLVKLGVSATSVGESSQVVVLVRNADGTPASGKQIHLDISVGGLFAECGTLSQRDVVTGSDGRATSRFTAPGTPLPMPDCSNFSGSVTVVATVVGSNSQAANYHTASIRMVEPTVIVSPGAASVNFSMSPNPAKVLTDVVFSDAGSSAASGRTIASYVWDFSDGATKAGAVVSHDFSSAGTKDVTLTVTDDIGQATFKTAKLTITN
jgi:hypothetical protein